MMMKTHKIKTSILYQLAFAAMVTVVTPAIAQTLLEENFSTGFEGWTVVHPTGTFNGFTRWQVNVAGKPCLETAMFGRPTWLEC